MNEAMRTLLQTPGERLLRSWEGDRKKNVPMWLQSEIVALIQSYDDLLALYKKQARQQYDERKKSEKKLMELQKHIGRRAEEEHSKVSSLRWL
jgi:hypothetical protein